MSTLRSFCISFFLIFYHSIYSAQDVPKPLRENELIYFTTQETEILKDRLLLKSVIPKGLYLIGHRGMGSTNNNCQDNLTTIPENTLESFKQAILSGADGIEFDIFETRDGHLLIIHDDELWKNVYKMDRSGKQLPAYETRLSFRVSQKDLFDLLKLSAGPRGQNPPAVSELFKLIEEANLLRKTLQMPPLILNIDVKSSKVSIKCLEWIKGYFQENRETSINIRHIYFTSPDPQALRDLQETAQRDYISLNTVLQITTEQIYGKENTSENFLVKNPSQYNRDFFETLQTWARSYQIKGIDCVLWDLNLPLLNLCKNEKLELHLYTSDYKYSQCHQNLGPLLHSLSQTLPVYLKTDHLQEKLFLLSRMNKDDLENPKKMRLDGHFPLTKPTNDSP